MSENYKIPDGLRVYAIGDVHGHLDLLKALHEEISMDLLRDAPDAAHIVYLGDYIDRGPDSRGVVDFLISRKERGDGIAKTFIRGNHEDGMFEFIKDPVHEAWLKWGGVETLASYGFEFEGDVPLPAEKERAAQEMIKLIPRTHFDFFDALEVSCEIGDYVFAHAGVDPLKPLVEQTHKDFTRIRQPFLSWHAHPEYRPLEKKVVHGHSISKEPVNRPHRVGVDTGAYEQGILTAGVFEGSDVRFLQVR